MKRFSCLAILALVAMAATGAQAFDLVTTAAVEIVEGVTVAQTTGMDFGQVADHDGALVLATNPASPMTDASFISFDPTGYTPAIFTVTSIAGASMNASFTDAGDVAGLALGTWTVSLDGGSTDEGDITDITQITSADTWNVGATLTVTAATAVVGAATPGYTITVVLN